MKRKAFKEVFIMRMFIEIFNNTYNIRMTIRTAMFGLDYKMAAKMFIEAGKELKNRKIYR